MSFPLLYHAGNGFSSRAGHAGRPLSLPARAVSQILVWHWRADAFTSLILIRFCLFPGFCRLRCLSCRNPGTSLFQGRCRNLPDKAKSMRFLPCEKNAVCRFLCLRRAAQAAFFLFAAVRFARRAKKYPHPGGRQRCLPGQGHANGSGNGSVGFVFNSDKFF